MPYPNSFKRKRRKFSAPRSSNEKSGADDFGRLKALPDPTESGGGAGDNGSDNEKRARQKAAARPSFAAVTVLGQSGADADVLQFSTTLQQVPTKLPKAGAKRRRFIRELFEKHRVEATAAGHRAAARKGAGDGAESCSSPSSIQQSGATSPNTPVEDLVSDSDISIICENELPPAPTTPRIKSAPDESEKGKLVLQQPPRQPSPASSPVKLEEPSDRSNRSASRWELKPRLEAEDADVEEVKRLLEVETQKPYDPLAGRKDLKSDLRSRYDHIGRDYKKGRMTKTESTIIRKAISDYFKQNDWSEQEGWRALSCYHPEAENTSHRGSPIRELHWRKIGMCLPQRPLKMIRVYAERAFFPWKRGPWSLEEEAEFADLVERIGTKWSKLAVGYLQRHPNYMNKKWKELQTRMAIASMTSGGSGDNNAGEQPTGGGRLIAKRSRYFWKREDDVALMKAVQAATGVPLPHHGIPWTDIHRNLPNRAFVTEHQCSSRYGNVIFPYILESRFRGPNTRVILRQALRYIKKGVDEGYIRDPSDIEMHRIVPYYFMGRHRPWLSRHIQLRCPLEIRNDFKESIEYLYSSEKCEERELRDLKALARGYKAIKMVNGYFVAPEKSGAVSCRYESPDAYVPYYEPTTSRGDKALDDANDDSMMSATALPLTRTPDLKMNDEIIASLPFSADGAADGRPLVLPALAAKIAKGYTAVPLHAAASRVADAVPLHRRAMPAALPIYVQKLWIKRQKRRLAAKRREFDKKAVAATIGSRTDDPDGKDHSSNLKMSYLDYHLMNSLGVLEDIQKMEETKLKENWRASEKEKRRSGQSLTSASSPHDMSVNNSTSTGRTSTASTTAGPNSSGPVVVGISDDDNNNNVSDGFTDIDTDSSADDEDEILPQRLPESLAKGVRELDNEIKANVKMLKKHPWMAGG